MGYAYSEIDYSHHKRKMQEPVMNDEDMEKIKDKRVILSDIDFDTGNSLQKVIDHLRIRNIDVTGAYIGSEDWPALGDFGMYYGFWMTERKGLRKLGDDFLYREGKVPSDFEIFTSTESNRISEAIRRVSEYIKNAGKL